MFWGLLATMSMGQNKLGNYGLTLASYIIWEIKNGERGSGQQT